MIWHLYSKFLLEITVISADSIYVAVYSDVLAFIDEFTSLHTLLITGEVARAAVWRTTAPRGSILGPVTFTEYAEDVSKILQRHEIRQETPRISA